MNATPWLGSVSPEAGFAPLLAWLAEDAGGSENEDLAERWGCDRGLRDACDSFFSRWWWTSAELKMDEIRAPKRLDFFSRDMGGSAWC